MSLTTLNKKPEPRDDAKTFKVVKKPKKISNFDEKIEKSNTKLMEMFKEWQSNPNLKIMSSDKSGFGHT
jgi:hypothetical protein